MYNVSHVKFLCEVFHLRLAHGGFEIVATFHAAFKITVGSVQFQPSFEDGIVIDLGRAE